MSCKLKYKRGAALPKFVPAKYTRENEEYRDQLLDMDMSAFWIASKTCSNGSHGIEFTGHTCQSNQSAARRRARARVDARDGRRGNAIVDRRGRLAVDRDRDRDLVGRAAERDGRKGQRRVRECDAGGDDRRAECDGSRAGGNGAKVGALDGDEGRCE